MANLPFSRYETMSKVHPQALVYQRLLLDLQVSDEEAPSYVNEYVEFLYAHKGSSSDHLKESLQELAKGKYERMRNKGYTEQQVVSVRNFDHLQSPQEGYEPVVDLVSYFNPQHGEEEHVDTVINSSTMRHTRASERAQEYRKEAGKRRKEFYQNFVNDVLLNANTGKGEYDTAPASVERENNRNSGLGIHGLKDATEVPVVENLGSFNNETLMNQYHASVLLPQRMYTLDNFFPKENCQAIVDKLNFTEEEILVNQKLIENERAMKKIVMRTSLRRKIIHPQLATAVWDGIKSVVPNTLEDGRKLVGVRSAMNFYRYAPGEFFDTHIDGGHVFRESGIVSEYTFILYLNECEGGGTRFCDVGEWDEQAHQVSPQFGRLLIFRQRDMKHCGMPVLKGFKYIIQGMVMYSPSAESKNAVKPSKFVPAVCSC